MDKSGGGPIVAHNVRSVEEILEGFDNRVLAVAWGVAFPGKGARPENIDAERVFQRHFAEFAKLREAYKSCLENRDKYWDRAEQYLMDKEKLQKEIEDLRKEIEDLRAQLAKFAQE